MSKTAGLPEFEPTHESLQIIDFIRSTFNKTNKTRAVIGLSGGIDSAVSFALTVKALGSENVYPFYLPSKLSNPIHLEDCHKLVASRQLPTTNFIIISIKGIIQKSWRIIGKNRRLDDSDEGTIRTTQTTQTSGGKSKIISANESKQSHRQEDFKVPSLGSENTGIFSAQPDPACGSRALQNPDSSLIARFRLANLAARIRMMILFDQAKKLDALVIGTENLSESLLGYFTRFGDEASDLEPIIHLYKTQVVSLAKHLNIPESIISKSPSADLWKGQTDAKELGFTYQQADPILYLLKDHTNQEIEQLGYSIDLVKKVSDQVNRNQFKHQVPYKLSLVHNNS